MGLLSPIPNRWCGVITNRTGRPTTTWGTTVTTGATPNVFTAYTQILAATAYETYHMRLIVHGIGAAAAVGDALMTIGIDRAGGTSYTDTISNLLVSGAGVAANGGITYEFPLYVPAGATVAAKVSTARASVSARVGVELYGKPSAPDLVRAGSYVLTYGANTAASNGTAITPGTTSEGTVVQVGTDVAKDVWWWQLGIGCSNTVMTGGGLMYTADLGVGTVSTTVDWIIEDQLHAEQNTSEQVLNVRKVQGQHVFGVPGGAGVDVFVRMQCSGTPVTGYSAAAYALGG